MARGAGLLAGGRLNLAITGKNGKSKFDDLEKMLIRQSPKLHMVKVNIKSN